MSKTQENKNMEWLKDFQICTKENGDIKYNTFFGRCNCC